MLISDHLNLMGSNPLFGPNFPMGPRFLDLTDVYTEALRAKIKEKVINIFQKKDSRNKILIVAAVLGVVLILLSELDFSTPKAEESVQTGDYAQYVSTLNDELTSVISSIDGVGDCKVMITLKNTKENVYAENSETSSSDSSNSENNEYVVAFFL